MPGTFPAPGDVVELEVLSAIPGQVAQNILHFFVQTTTTGGASLQEIANAYDTRIFTDYKAILSSKATYRGVGATNLATPRTRQYFSIAHAGLGGGDATLLPTQTRGLLSWYADAAKPRNRGRTYIPFPSANFADANGLPTAFYLALLNSVRNAMAPNLTVAGAGGSATLQMCITHRPPVAIGPSIVVFAFTRTLFATQRRSGSYGRSNSPHF